MGSEQYMDFQYQLTNPFQSFDSSTLWTYPMILKLFHISIERICSISLSLFKFWIMYVIINIKVKILNCNLHYKYLNLFYNIVHHHYKYWLPHICQKLYSDFWDLHLMIERYWKVTYQFLWIWSPRRSQFG